MRRKVAAHHSSLPKAVPWEAPAARTAYSHFPRCLSGSSRPGTVSAAGNSSSPGSCCWTTGPSATLCRCGSRPSAWRGSDGWRAGLATHLPGRGLWVCHTPCAFPSTFRNFAGTYGHPDILLILKKTTSERGLSRCHAHRMGETSGDAGSGDTLPEVEPLLCYFLAV